jgi:hypothetical protein
MPPFSTQRKYRLQLGTTIFLNLTDMSCCCPTSCPCLLFLALAGSYLLSLAGPRLYLLPARTGVTPTEGGRRLAATVTSQRGVVVDCDWPIAMLEFSAPTRPYSHREPRCQPGCREGVLSGTRLALCPGVYPGDHTCAPPKGHTCLGMIFIVLENMTKQIGSSWAQVPWDDLVHPDI